ncbi:hypothetical protein [Emticicia fontis]
MENPKQGIPINTTALSAAEVEMYQEKLTQRKGAKEEAIKYSGLSRWSYYNVMNGGRAKKSTVRKVIAANLKVIKLFINQPEEE